MNVGRASLPGQIRGRLGLALCANVVRPRQQACPSGATAGSHFDGEVQASDKIDLLKAFNLQELANDLRRLHALQPSPELEGRIQWLVRRRDWALSQEWLHTAHSYNLEHMVACLMLGEGVWAEINIEH